MRVVAVVLMAAIGIVSSASASGPIGIYGVVERVVFEPSEAAPERIQVWGAFAYADGAASQVQAVSPVERGYLYFKLPDVAPGGPTDLVKREWADLRAVAGTGQAVAFGRWGYIGSFGSLRPDRPASGVPLIYADVARGGAFTDLRVRPASERPSSPATYQTNAGIVRLAEQGSHAAIVAELKKALR